MKKITYLVFFLCVWSYSQKNSPETPHLERKNEIRIGIENTLFSLEYERQLNDHFSLGAVFNNGEGEYDFNNYQDLYIGIRGRHYFKHYITQSFLYLFFDDKFKIRYFAEGNLGYSRSNKLISVRYLDEASNFVLDRQEKTNHNMAGSLGLGLKLLYTGKYAIDFSFGGGNYFNKRKDSYGYVRIGYGYRF